jgi:TonB-linked SusC/RagA family outer membrane protein
MVVQRRWGFVAALLVTCAGEVRAQDAVLRGRVMSDRGEPVPAAMVGIPEFGVQTLTGADGRFALAIAGARVRGQQVILRVRQIGFKPSSRAVALMAGEQELNFALVTDVNMLETVVVTGVQEAVERVKVPFAVTQVDATRMPVPAANPLTQLQGKVPGAHIVSASGRPGAQPSVVLRGPTSINASGRSQGPLYIVDGVITNGALPDLNPSDIENVEVVKGAAGASLYGARAGNGVIQITTKSGRRALDGVEFTVRSEAGISDIERDFGLARYHALLTDETGRRFCEDVTDQPLCAVTFDYHAEQARVNNAPGDFVPEPKGFPVDPGASIAGSVLRQRFQVQPWPGVMYNAVDEVVDPHPYTQNSVDMTGRFGATRFFASAANLTQQGAIRFLEGYWRNSFRLNVDQAIGDQWSVALRSYYSRGVGDGLDQEDGGRSFFRLTRVPAINDVLKRDTLGRLYVRPNIQDGGSQNENPLLWLENQTRQDEINRIIGGATVQYQPVEWLNVDANFSYDFRRRNWLQFRDKGFRTTTAGGLNGGFVNRGADIDEALNSSINVVARHEFRPELRGRLSVRYLYEQSDGLEQSANGGQLAVQGVTSLANTRADTREVDSEFEPRRQIAVFGGVGLDYKDRYILDALIRRDGSSLFGRDNRWATFGRASLAWRVAHEPWWFVPAVNEFKVRGSYGTAGGSPRFSAQYETFAIATGGILTLQTAGNRKLRPEVNKEREVGLDVELLDRYGLTFTYARATIDNQMHFIVPSATSGFANRWENIGSLLSITWELSLNVPIIQRPDLSWAMQFNYDRNRTFITRLTVPPFTYDEFYARVGERLGTFYGRRFVQRCNELPASFQRDCGRPGSSFQRNDEGWIVWVGAGNSWRDGITKNLWETQLPAGSAPWAAELNWGMPVIIRGEGTDGRGAAFLPLGNALPDFRFSVTQTVNWRRLTLYALLDATIGQDIWNEGFHWAHLDFLSKDVDQYGKSVETAKPIGYYWRASPVDGFSGIGGFYDRLAPNNHSVEDASYAKLRELLVSYRIGPVRGLGDWEVSVVGRNLFTITGYRGFDPEVGDVGGTVNSGAIRAVDDFTFPNVRTMTVALSSRF